MVTKQLENSLRYLQEQGLTTDEAVNLLATIDDCLEKANIDFNAILNK